MKRRTFLKTASASSLACAFPQIFPTLDDPLFSTEELMGKAEIELFGEGINLRKEAHDAFLEMKKAAYSDGFDIKTGSACTDMKV